jgi:uncharacterized protein YecE (DUF72 family)
VSRKQDNSPAAENLSLFDVAPVSSAPKEDLHSDAGPTERIGPASEKILLGTSAFTANGWEGTFYPAGMKPAQYLTHYANCFRTVEVDSTFYGTPQIARVQAWYEKTPPDFVFAAKVPQVITHDKVLLDCDAEFSEFISTMKALKEKLGPLLLQFGFFQPNMFRNGHEFLARLIPFLSKLPHDHRFVVEIRNKRWLDGRFLDVLREHRVALALTDHSWMPRPWEVLSRSGADRGKPLDLITSDFAYVRWLGDRKSIEAITTSWDKTVVDRRGDLLHWVKLFRQLVSRNLTVYAYANNHYAGNGPGTVKLFWEMFEKTSRAHSQDHQQAAKRERGEANDCGTDSRASWLGELSPDG